MSDQNFKELNKTNKFLNFLKEKSKTIIILLLAILLVIIGIFLLNLKENRKNTLLSEQYNNAKILINEKIIFGLANANSAFAHNSIWLNILPIFYINENYDFILIPTFLIYLIFIIYSFSQIINEKIKTISSFFLIVCLFYIVLKFTRISEYGNDIPALIFTILAIVNFFKFQEERNLKKNSLIFFAILVLLYLQY